MAKWDYEEDTAVPGTEYFDGDIPATKWIDAKELAKLREDQQFLQALIAAGVEDWEGYADVCAATAELEDPEL